MSKNKYASVDELLEDLTEEQLLVVDALNSIFEKQSGVVVSMKWDCLHYRFRNGMWCYINCRKKKYPVL
jgi:hypothetical protein